MPKFQKRTEPLAPEAAKAVEDLKATLKPVLEPPLLRMVEWLDRQLQRSPRLYRWLSR